MQKYGGGSEAERFQVLGYTSGSEVSYDSRASFFMVSLSLSSSLPPPPLKNISF